MLMIGDLVLAHPFPRSPRQSITLILSNTLSYISSRVTWVSCLIAVVVYLLVLGSLATQFSFRLTLARSHTYRY